MHIVMLSDLETSGGAALAASRLAEALCDNHVVTRLVLHPDGAAHPWQTIPLGRRSLVARVAGKVGRTLGGPFPHLASTLDRRRIAQTLASTLTKLRPDVINVHNIHLGATQGWSPELVRVCAEFAPVVWTLHDMWSFTGRCAYAYDCRKFETGCDAACPTPGEYPSLEPTRIGPAWEARRRLFHDLGNLSAVAPSRWLAEEASKGHWAGHRVRVIPYSLPLETFRPLEDRHAARAALGLDASAPVVFVVAHQLSEVRKGGHLLPHIWRHVPQRPLTLLTMGSGEVPLEDPGIRVVPLGWVTDPVKQVQAYNAADVLLHPAPVDNFPCVVMEAIACGTPVVAFPIGGLPEMVLPRISGWLAPHVTPQALGTALGEALDSMQSENLRGSCREHACREFAPTVQRKRYEKVFPEMKRCTEAA